MEILILFFLILLNGFFALSEIALISSRMARLEQAVAAGKKGATTAVRLLGDSENFLSAIQVGITLIGIVTGVYGGMNIADDVAPLLEGIEPIGAYAHEISLTFTVIVITYVSIVLGELVPKTIALSNPDRIAIRVAPLIYWFSKLFYPFVRLLSLSTSFINGILGISKQQNRITEAELRHIIKQASSEGVIEKEQNRIHENIFYFSDKKAKHIMTHRTDLEWIDLENDFNHLKKELMKMQHSKVICCRGGLDNIEGILYLKDFFRYATGSGKKHLRDLIVKPVAIPENADAQTVLNHLRINRSHICFVLNEYGGFEGIITLHDIMENIVGQIPNEGEAYEPDIFVRDDDSILVNGDAPIETLAEIFDNFIIDFEKIDYSTVAGFVFSRMNSIPKTGDKFSFGNYEIEILDLDGNRIDKILIKKRP